MSNDPQSLGRSIRQRRIDLGLSQGDIAESLGISRTTISHMENGRPGTVATLLDVLDGLGLDLLVAPRHSKDATVLRNRMANVLAQTKPAVRVKRNIDG